MSDKPFASEAEMCAAFVSCLSDGWVAYPETAGWDILLVRPADGFQIGVEAKLRLNAKVFAQALEGSWPEMSGPDCRAVLVPMGESGAFGEIAAYIGLTIIGMRRREHYDRPHHAFHPELPKPQNRYGYVNNNWREMLPVKRCRLPDYVPDVCAGHSAPVQLTHWKIQAIKIGIILETRGFVTRADFKALGLDHRRWTSAWLDIDPSGRGWIAGPYTPNFRIQHPTNYEQIKADADKWMPPPALVLQPALDLVRSA